MKAVFSVTFGGKDFTFVLFSLFNLLRSIEDDGLMDFKVHRTAND